MHNGLSRQLDLLYAEGQAHDEVQPDRRTRYRNLEPASASLLAQLVRIANACAVLEIGTSNGYSTIWLADAAHDLAGHVTSVDIATTEAARRNLTKAGLDGTVDLVVADGGTYLSHTTTGSVDLLFLDAERYAYADWWPDIERVVRPGGLLVVDNALAPDPADLSSLRAAITATDQWTTSTVSTGKGLLLAWNHPAPWSRRPAGSFRTGRR